MNFTVLLGGGDTIYCSNISKATALAEASIEYYL
jgi:hypothetical protein